MEIKVLGCSGGRSPGMELTSYMVDSTLLIDTGAASSSLSLPEQEAISDVLLTHAHLDHILGLALLYENTRDTRLTPIDVYATEEVIKIVREDLMIPELMPIQLEKSGELTGVNFHTVVTETPFRVGDFEVEAFPVFHTKGSVAYRVSDSEHTLMYTGDTGRTDRIWRWLKKRGGVDCLIAEVSFPNQMQQLADLSRHLTPAGLVTSLEKAGLDPDHEVHIVHLKPAFLHDLLEEIEALRDWNLLVLRRGDTIRLEPGRSQSKVVGVEAEKKVRDQLPEFDRDSDLYDQRKHLSEQFGFSASEGDTIFRQGDNSKVMYVIQEGTVRIYRSASGVEKTLAIIGPGDFFGEMAMLNNRPRSATAEALSDVRLLAFDKKAFEKMLTENFGVALLIIRTLAQRLHDADLMIENMLYLDPQSKVINTLIQTAYDEGIETREGFLVRTNPEVLSEKSGVVLATLRGILSDLVKTRLVIARREALVIPNIPKLKRMLTFLELKDEFAS